MAKRSKLKALRASSNKYGARKVYAVIDGLQRCSRFHSLEIAKRFAESAHDNSVVVVFDSVHEFEVYKELNKLARAGAIKQLERQKRFILIPPQYETVLKNGKEKRKLLERALHYTADFTYYDADGNFIVVDAKSRATRTRDYIIRRKLMLFLHGIKIVEM